MFESAELGHRLSKEVYAEIEPKLRTDLLDAQFSLLDNKYFATVILINGIDGAGRGETVNLLNEWMDPRHIEVHAFDQPTDEELERPFLWRFWRALPPKGKIGILFGNWYSDSIGDRAFGRIKKAHLDQRLSDLNRFEAMLTAEGVLLVKFWFHLSRPAQKKRLKALEANPDTRWRVREADWHYYDEYDRYREVAEHVLRRTSTGIAPWVIVDGTDPQYRAVHVGRTLLDRLQRRIEFVRKGFRPRQTAAPLTAAPDERNLLNALILDQPMDKKEYDAQLEKLQGRLALALRLFNDLGEPNVTTSAIAEELNTGQDDVAASSAAWILVALRTNLLAQVQRDTLNGLARPVIVDRLIRATNRAFDLLQGPIATLGGGTGPHR